MLLFNQAVLIRDGFGPSLDGSASSHRLAARSCPSISESSLKAHSFFRRKPSATSRHVPTPCLELRTGNSATPWTVVDDVGIRLDSLPTSRATSVPLTPVNPGQPRQPAAPHQRTSTSTTPRLPMIPKLNTRVRFPSSAPSSAPRNRRSAACMPTEITRHEGALDRRLTVAWRHSILEAVC